VSDEVSFTKDPAIDSDGVLHMLGKFKNDDKKINFELKFLYEAGLWKVVGINVKYNEE
jgi:hypothetical protein